MPHRNPPDIPIEMAKVSRRLERWRKIRRGREPIPKRLWAAAVSVAREHGINPTSKALHLEFRKLKEFVESGKPAKRKRTAGPMPEFVELMPSAPASNSECVIEWEGRHGKMRIHWKGMTAADLGQLSRMMMEQA